MTTLENVGNNSLLNNTLFINAVNIADFLLGLQNMSLNLTADDLEKHTGKITEELTRQLDSIDKHLREQDKRIERIENFLHGKRGYNR